MQPESKLNEKNKKRLKVRRGSIGLGLFANDKFKKGEKIIEYVGKIITSKEAEDVKVNRFLFEIDDKFTIDGRPRWNLARYANHCCKPNAEAEVVKGKIYISAIKNINPGDEITYDYGKEYLDEYIKKGTCKCLPCESTSVR